MSVHWITHVLFEAESNKNGVRSPPFLELSVIICDLGIVSVKKILMLFDGVPLTSKAYIDLGDMGDDLYAMEDDLQPRGT